MRTWSYSIADIRHGDDSFTVEYLVHWSYGEIFETPDREGYAQITRRDEKWDVTLITGPDAPDDDFFLQIAQMYRYWYIEAMDDERERYSPISAGYMLFLAEWDTKLNSTPIRSYLD